jgi:hypothetical protein
MLGSLAGRCSGCVSLAHGSAFNHWCTSSVPATAEIGLKKSSKDNSPSSNCSSLLLLTLISSSKPIKKEKIGCDQAKQRPVPPCTDGVHVTIQRSRKCDSQ